MKIAQEEKNRSELFIEFFKDSRPHTANELMSQLGFSRSSITRHLKKNKALTSVNSNGQYYVLPKSVKFNKYGLVNVEGKVFSRHGNLLDTIVNIINESPCGFFTVDIEELVETNVQSQCLNLFKEKKIFRKRYGKTYCNFAIEKKEREQQLSTRSPVVSIRDIDSQLDDETIDSLRDTTKVIIAYVRNPQLSPKSIALSLFRRGNDITTKKVIATLKKYDIVKKNF